MRLNSLSNVVNANAASAMPKDPEFRFAGYAAVAVTRLGLLAQPEISDPLERAVASRFTDLRGRLRGSTLIPRNVEYAFAGDVTALEAVALDPTRRDVIDKLLKEGFELLQRHAGRREGIPFPPAEAAFADEVAQLA